MSCVKDFIKLKDSKDFKKVYKTAKSAHSSFISIFFLSSSKNLIGYTSSKKVGNAVQRNRAKRRMRALFLEFKVNLKRGTYVFVARKNTNNVSYEKLKANTKKIFKDLKVLNE